MTVSVLILAPSSGELAFLVSQVHRRLQRDGEVRVVDSEEGLLKGVRRGGIDLVFLPNQSAESGLLETLRKRYPLLPIVLAIAEDGFDALAAAIRQGATEAIALEPPLDERVDVVIEKLGGVRELMAQTRNLEREAARLHRAEDARYHIVGRSPQMMEVRSRISRVARIPRPVLIQGERGTGKELVARAIHREGGSAEGPFVAVNCAALPDTLLESELFGHEKGAFTGAATSTRGKFEQATRGTLFLDEIGHMSLPFQQKILRVVEYRRFTRVGGHDEITVETRIIAATNVDMKEKMRKGQFLPDLYDRLAFEVINVPPLREREGEIEILAEYFLEQFMHEVPAFSGKRLSRAAIDLLYTYDFPGNVRELKNIIERAVYRDTTNELTPEDIGLLSDHHFQAPGGSFKDKVGAFERQLLSDALRAASGNQAQAARSLGIRYHQLRHFLKKHGLDEPR